MAHMTPEEFACKQFGITDEQLRKLPIHHTQWLECMQAYHDYTLEQAAKDVEVIKRLIETDEDSVFNEIPVYMGIDKHSILQHKLKK